MDREEFLEWLDFQPNPYHPLVWINGDPQLGDDLYIGFFSVINAKDSNVVVGDGCDIAPFTSINCADSHRKCLGLTETVDREPIHLENDVFVGTQSVVKPGAHIGHHSVVGADEVVSGDVPPCSLVVDGTVKRGYYEDQIDD